MSKDGKKEKEEEKEEQKKKSQTESVVSWKCLNRMYNAMIPGIENPTKRYQTAQKHQT